MVQIKFLLGRLLYVLFFCSLLAGCAGGRKLANVEQERITASVAVGSLDDVEAIELAGVDLSSPQIVEVQDMQGNKIVMNAVRDEESGEMVATEKLDEIVVVAKFRHVAERNGIVDLVFELSVPMELQKDRWQVRFTPQYFIMGDTLDAEKIFITGKHFRKVQSWEHLMYDNYIGKIVSPEVADTLYLRKKQMERFMLRYEDISGGKNRLSMEERAARHYRMGLLDKMNHNRTEGRDRIYSKFIRDPFPIGGVRLDSVVYDKSTNGIRYYYVQSIKTRPGLKKIDMIMSGEIFTNGRKLCDLIKTEPITFYISSISSFADLSERYLKKVIHRDLHLSTSYNIEFRKNKWNIDPNFSHNRKELSSIKRNIAQILDNREYAMDSIIITASGSPDGTLAVNERISRKRGEAIGRYVSDYVKFYKDSIGKSVWNINIDESYREEKRDERDFDESNIKSSFLAEDWDSLYSLLERDTLLLQKGSVMALFMMDDLDAREKALKRCADFDYIEENLYPKLRRVKFNFKLHRKGVLKDTVHTTELDTVYMSGVKALMDRDYKLAVTLLREYHCYNTAVAFVCMDYNKSALEILLGLPTDARRDYMLAVIYSRLGDEKLAVEYYKNSVGQDENMRHRGNLDPEISALIKKYQIFTN